MSSAALRQVELYTDGGCRPNPGPGGWAASLRCHWVRGHTGHVENERVDALATAAIGTRE